MTLAAARPNLLLMLASPLMVLDDLREAYIGLLGATVAHGRRAGFLRGGWIPGRYFARWMKAELGRAARRAGWDVLRLETVDHRERKGRWLTLIARRIQ